MRRTRLQRILCLTIALLVIGAAPLRAEVSAQPGPNEVGVMILGIIEGPDPIPQIIWDPVRDVDPALFLNSAGAARGDGRPDVFNDPVTGWPHVVWAYNNGTDSDIAYSCWDGSGWAATEFLTAGTVDEVDPRIFVDTSAIYVVWWEPGNKTIRLVKRPHAGTWGLTEMIGGYIGTRPSVATWGGIVLVASEQNDGHGGTTIYLSTRVAVNTFDTAAIGGAPQEQPLDVVLHNEQGQLWLDWRHSPTQFAYSVSTGGSWSPATTLPWVDDSWLQLEQVRLMIRGLVMTAP